MRNRKKYLFGIGLFITACQIQANTYSVGLDTVYQSALSVSNEYRALENEALSAGTLTDAAKKYYLPTLSLTGELYKYYGSGTPAPEEASTLKLNVEMKIWGTGVTDKILAANSNLEALQLVVTGEELSVYHTVLRYLAKIERTRVYLADNENIERRLKIYLEKQRTSFMEGASALSSLKEAELEYSRFKDSVTRIRASIDQMFRSLREETNYKTETPEEVGISLTMLESLLAQDIASITALDIVKTNIQLRNRNLLLDYQLKTAQSQRERFSISLVNETQFEVLGSDDWNSGDTKTASYFGLEATYDLFNYQNSQSQKLAYYLYDAENERVNLLQVQLAAELNSLQKEFLDTKDKRASLIEQIVLNEDLVSTQENELLIDKLEYVDIVQSMSGLSASYVTLLDYDLSLIDAVVDTMSLQSEKFMTNE